MHIYFDNYFHLLHTLPMNHIKNLKIQLFSSNAIFSLPTFIIAECVLIYLDPESSRSVVSWASRTFSTAAFFLYEQVGGDFSFFLNLICCCILLVLIY